MTLSYMKGVHEGKAVCVCARHDRCCCEQKKCLAVQARLDSATPLPFVPARKHAHTAAPRQRTHTSNKTSVMRDIASIHSGQCGSKFITPREGGDAGPPALRKDTRRQRRRAKSSGINNKVQLHLPPSRCSAPSLGLLVACVAVAASALAVGAFAAASVITVGGRTAMTGGVNGPFAGAFGHVLAGAPVLLALNQSVDGRKQHVSFRSARPHRDFRRRRALDADDSRR